MKFVMDNNRVVGQTISFEFDRLDRSIAEVKVTPAARTIKSIAARKGQPKAARDIADYNGIVSIVSKLKIGRVIKLPGWVISVNTFKLEILAGDSPPTITGGYAKWSTVDRPQRVGIAQFDGYDPITMDIPVRFLTTRRDQGGLEVEQGIAALEQMAGRGNFPGAAVGAPGTVKITCDDGNGRNVPLIPNIYQSDRDGSSSPLRWVVTGIAWDPNPRRNDQGNRIDQQATVSVQQYTRPATNKVGTGV
jgi:hypothetical protein